MSDSNEEMTPEELKRKAYRIGLQLKSQGLDSEVIYARLEKQGIPEDMAIEVAKDIMMERKFEVRSHAKSDYNNALTHIGIGVVLALLSVVIFPGFHLIPIGIIGGGIVSALLAKRRMEE